MRDKSQNHRAEADSSATKKRMTMNGNIDFMQEVFCFTGKMEMTRYEMWAAVEHRGGEYVRDINDECTCLVYGLKPGSKLKRAQQMGIKMMSSTDFTGAFRCFATS